MGETRFPGRFWLFFLLSAALVAAPCAGRTITVDANGTGDYPTIQTAIDDSNDGDVIVLCPGTYTGPGNRDIDFKGKAIAVRSSDPNDRNAVATTIIDCLSLGRGFYFHTGEDVNSIVRGLTITNGNTNGGAGIYCHDSSPLIADCTFTENVGGVNGIISCEAFMGAQTTRIVKCNISRNSGAGVYCYRSSFALDIINITIADCIISGNSGAGVSSCSGSLKNSSISGNGGEAGVYHFNGDIIKCLISGNSNSGIVNGSGTVAGCIISGNTTKTGGSMGSGTGGGIRCSSFGGLITNISNCMIFGNSASNEGGGIYCQGRSPQIINCMISGNYAGSNGGGIYSYSNTLIRSCTITQNKASGLGHGVYCAGTGNTTLTNSIVWANQVPGANQIASYSGSVTVSWSDIQGGWPGQGNIAADPLFTSDYHLTGDSPCIDAGDPCYASPGGTDIDGEQRVSNGRVDMGADEFIDTDADGLLDWWERKYFGPGLDAQPQGNPDNDDWPNLKEQMHGSDPLAPSDYYVNPTDGNDAWDGLAVAWDGEHGPKKTIQAAVDACTAGQVILVPASYTGDGNRDIDLRGRAITLRSINPQDPNTVAGTIIDAQGSASEPHRGFYLHSREGPYSTIAGLTITGGNIERVPRGTEFGGAIWADFASPTLILCNIIANRAYSGGGIAGTFSEITRCTIADNIAIGGDGGGLLGSSARIDKCIFINNSAHSGGGLSTGYVIISDCLISNNRATVDGGGVHAFHGPAAITNCTITGNCAPRGGAIYAIGETSTVTVANSTIADNLANSTGGVCRFDGGSATFVNSILWGYSVPKVVGSTSITFSDIEGGYAGQANINTDPCFADPGYWQDPYNTATDVRDDVWVGGDYHLKSQGGRWDANEGRWAIDDLTSPCIDAGDPMSPIGYEPFPNGGRINMGAYGGTAEASKSYFGEPSCETIVAGDVNGDCIVDFKDFFFVALHWLQDDNQ